MKIIWNLIFLVLQLVLPHPTYSVSLRVDEKEGTIPFTANMLPILTNFTVINSTAIEAFWHPSLSIEGVNLTQFTGAFTNSLYAGTERITVSASTIYDRYRLNQTDYALVNRLSADTVYQVCSHNKWHKENSTINSFNNDGLFRRECRLLRTYTENQTTLNPVPQLGAYSWKEKVTSNGTLAIIINTTISSELPYRERSVSVTLGSKIQHRQFSTPIESIEFEFDGLKLKPKDYPLMINFSLVDSTIEHLFTTTNILNGTVTITTTTTALNMANKQFACHSLLLVLLTLFVSFSCNKHL